VSNAVSNFEGRTEIAAVWKHCSSWRLSGTIMAWNWRHSSSEHMVCILHIAVRSVQSASRCGWRNFGGHVTGCIIGTIKINKLTANSNERCGSITLCRLTEFLIWNLHFKWEVILLRNSIHNWLLKNIYTYICICVYIKMYTLGQVDRLKGRSPMRQNFVQRGGYVPPARLSNPRWTNLILYGINGDTGTRPWKLK
jgi:hypothetical protein